jgi:hypothetical protein
MKAAFVVASQKEHPIMSRRKQGQERPRKVKGSPLDVLAQLNLHAAGLDIGDQEIYAAVPEGREESSVRAFPTFTADLQALADWLEGCGVTSVVMERVPPGRGIYWIPIYEIKAFWLDDRSCACKS